MRNLLLTKSFLEIFSGKTNSYTIRKDGKGKPGEKTEATYRSVSGDVDRTLIDKHLDGEFSIGVNPVNNSGECFFGVIDIDYYKSDVLNLVKTLYKQKSPFVPIRSKSGGLHLYVFLSEAVSAEQMRSVLKKTVDLFALNKIYNKKVEIFPKQTEVTSFGSTITLPYSNSENPVSYMLDNDCRSVTFSDFLTNVYMYRTTIKQIESWFLKLPYSDAPPCIQSTMLSSLLQENRNLFLFSFAVYAKKKHGEGFTEVVAEANNSFFKPLESQEVESLIRSVESKEYHYKCKEEPLCSVCNKGECKKREYGLHREKGHFTGIDYGKIYRYNASEPYYIWKLRLNGDTEWKDVVFKDEAVLLEQKYFAKMCVRYLNTAPMQVASNDWYDILNSVLPTIEDVEVSVDGDTSALSVLRHAFITYLTSKQARKEFPFQIRMGMTVFQDGKFYFTHIGWYDYLKSKRITFEMATMRETLKRFGAKEDVLIYQNASGGEVSFPCWSKEEDSALMTTKKNFQEIEEFDRKRTSTTIESFQNDIDLLI